MNRKDLEDKLVEIACLACDEIIRRGVESLDSEDLTKLALGKPLTKRNGKVSLEELRNA